MSKPREWWLREETFYWENEKNGFETFLRAHENRIFNKEGIKVIEKSAYDALLAQAEAMAEALNLGITEEHGEKTHLGFELDHKDCDLIRETLETWQKFLEQK